MLKKVISSWPVLRLDVGGLPIHSVLFVSLHCFLWGLVCGVLFLFSVCLLFLFRLAGIVGLSAGIIEGSTCRGSIDSTCCVVLLSIPWLLVVLPCGGIVLVWVVVCLWFGLLLGLFLYGLLPLTGLLVVLSSDGAVLLLV